ncbi:MAG: hypothetical protein PW789_10000 [Edaphobacter sp.]|uniref:hypothetical protein n=1 Tax=Edaphobacter sp. TaxID=1934404 RepID=UPI002382A9A0|nr:hypothetical protein [Edaphobacter sp.]MDE1176924.1 hypothetical protein [Edaphobacter sp.]
MRHRFKGLVCIGACLLAGRAVRAENAPAVETIVSQMQQKNSERQRELEGYTAERTYRVEYHGTGGEHRGEINVHMQYGDHGEKHFTVVSESGSKLICERVLRKMMATEQEASERSERMQMMLSEENYSFELQGQEMVDGVEAWVLRVAPKVDNKLTYRGRIWVSEDDFAVVRVQGEPAKNPSWWINRASFDWRYGRHGRFWLPERSTAMSHVRIGGEATLTIDYGNYRILAEQKTTPSTERPSSVPVQLAEHISAK